jgi:hypothetical protein
VKVQGCWKAPFFIDYQRLARMKVWGETFFLFFTHIISRPLHRDSKKSTIFDIFTFKDYDTRRNAEGAAGAGIYTQVATET